MELRMFLLSFAGLSIWHLPRICKACNPDQIEFSGSRYIFCQNALDFYSAQSSCENLGMHVVNIESQEEQNFLVETIEDGDDPDRDYWIGLSAVTWLDGTRLTYDNFGSGSRVFNEGARCFRMIRRWNDDNCAERKRFLCEGEGGE
ncbi:C-type lectin domain family 4 member G-like [Lytechinus variegatus]|uniref:C-type lectin domain family 4 member G-like n=1 Tax=Lytechinus variegatus TaxID=7654 RepID=UPI001BB208F8|nr:C-type lectin domain family 4 member G-like [Lytechinus variegatus]